MRNSTEYIHLVAFDIPYPANYGGVIDIFYKLKALHSHGVKIILHCYQYGREQSRELQKYAHEVNYYKRRTFRNPFYGKLPYIVASRNTSELLENLKKNQHPILFEGLHCCYYLNHPDLKHRIKVVRTHNIEHDYYRKLEEVENNFFKKYFFRIESERLKKFESNLKHASLIAAISPADHAHFVRKFDQSFYLPAFHPNEKVDIRPGRGNFAFYHGNLSVGENDQAARFLVNEVFNDGKYPLIIAGSNPSKELVASLEGKKQVTLVNNLSSEQMLQYIQEAQVNILPTFQNTGIKLKLINSLYLGRHCLVNHLMVDHTELEPFCTVANTPGQFRKALKVLWEKTLTGEEMESRRAYLEDRFDNGVNAGRLMAAIRSVKK